MKKMLTGSLFAVRGLRAMPLLFGIAIAFTLHAQTPPTNEFTRAAELNDEGRFPEAIRIIESFFAQGPQNDHAITGIAWDLRGVALQNLGDWEGARRSYEASVAILRTEPDQIRQYASALDNLGSLKQDLGQLQESRSLRIHARQLYRSVGDHAGTARASVNLALVALGLRDRRQTRKFLADAFSEESLVQNPDLGDLAALHSAQAIQVARNGRPNEALDEINHAIALWTQRYGPHYYLLATGLSLRGSIDDSLHKNSDARSDFRLSLDILKMNGEADSQVFYLVESAYAGALRDSGEHDEADRLESEAKEGLERLRRPQCNGCSISAESFR